jgi:hypothetical protein
MLAGAAKTGMAQPGAGAAASDSEDATVITELAAELGVCLDKAVFVVNRQPPELVDGLPGRFVGISDDPYAFERDGDRVSISLATAFGTGIKALAEMALSGGERGGGAEAVIEAAGEALDKRKIGNGKQDEYFAA